MKIFLIGNPNVGKSVIFSRLTGAKVIASNYPGTTVTFSKGNMSFPNIKAEVVDAPGTYSLEPTTKVEEVTTKLIKEADIIINIVDATNLERNLYLTLELIHKVNKPLLLVLNMWDETKHKGIDIDIKKLEEILGIPVVATCGLSGEGIKDLVFSIKKSKISPLKISKKDIWCDIGGIVKQVQKLFHKHHTFLDIMQDLSIKPPFSFLMAVIVVFLSFLLVRSIGEGLINHIFDPLFENLYTPFIMKPSSLFDKWDFLHSILIGELIEGKID